MSDEAKKNIVTELANHYRVFVSLEKSVKDAFYNPYTLHVSPEKMHDLEANAKLMLTEGATMASESFVHGVPYLYLNPLRCGYIDYQCRNYPDRAFQTTNEDEALDIIRHMIALDNDTDKARGEIEKLTINPTAFLEWFVEHFPDSITSDYWPTS
ncbi:MAG: hypothetical protein K6F02_09000 [Prevotella sp.]|nr:hypothetical protein [Prevotella sp.]